MNLKSITYLLSILVLMAGCTYVEPYEVNAGKLVLNIGESRMPVDDDAVQTRATVNGRWIVGDHVTTNVSFIDSDGAEINADPFVIEYEYDGTTWNVTSGEESISLPINIKRISIEAVMSHEYSNPTDPDNADPTDTGDMEGNIPVRGKETMSATAVIDNVIASEVYTIVLDDWRRTSALLEITGFEDVHLLMVRKGDGADYMNVTNNGYDKAYFHVTPSAYLAVVKTVDNDMKSYGINAKILSEGKKTIYNLAKYPVTNGLFDPFTKLPIIPEYPGYIKYQEEGESITTFHVANADGLKNAFTEIGIGDQNTVVKLENDIDLSGSTWVPIGEDGVGFKGTFDGNGKIIEGMNSTVYLDADKTGIESGEVSGNEDENSRYQCTGLMGYLEEGAVLKNVILKDVFIEVKAVKPNMDIMVGAFVGVNKGRIENCHLLGSATIGSSVSAVGWPDNPADFDSRAGGITGMNLKGEIIGCTVSGKVDIVAKGNRFTMAGGIVGWNFGDIVACYVDGNRKIYDTDVQEELGIRMIAESEHTDAQTRVGGIAGVNNKSEVTNPDGSETVFLGRVIGCYFNGDNLSKLEYISAYNGDNQKMNKAAGGIAGYGAEACEARYTYWYYEPNTSIPAYGHISNSTVIIMESVSNLTGSITWATASSNMNTGIQNYINGGGECVWRYRQSESSQPDLYIP